MFFPVSVFQCFHMQSTSITNLLPLGPYIRPSHPWHVSHLNKVLLFHCSTVRPSVFCFRTFDAMSKTRRNYKHFVWPVVLKVGARQTVEYRDAPWLTTFAMVLGRSWYVSASAFLFSILSSCAFLVRDSEKIWMVTVAFLAQDNIKNESDEIIRIY